MKTIAETVKDNQPWSKAIIAALEAREAERDKAERERVKAALQTYCILDYVAKDIIKTIYPPPKPEKLPAGWYAVKGMVGEPFPHVFESSFVPSYGHEYRPIPNPFDPPPEVTGKAEPVPTFEEVTGIKSQHPLKHAEPVLPTFEEWCAENSEIPLETLKAALLKLGRIRG